MSIAQFNKRKSFTEFRKVQFINLPQGKHTVRFLQSNAVTYDTHFIRKITVKCLGDDCPICANNKRLYIEYGKEARTRQEFIAQRQVGYINVLDKTPAKVCPQCGTEVKKIGNTFPATCTNTACNASLVSVKAQPLNKVKVFSKGKTVYDQLEFHNDSILDEETQTPLGFTNYDFEIIVIGGANNKTAPTLNPLPETFGQEVVYDEKDLFDLEKEVIIELSAHEMLELQRGVMLRDILASRKAEEVEEAGESVIDDSVRADMDSLFEN